MKRTKENQYKAVKALLESGQIKQFKDIFDYIPKSVVGKDVRINNPRITRLMENPGGFTFIQIKRLADHLKFDFKELVLLVADSCK